MYKINNFNLRIPVVAAPMFTISNPNLVISQCTSGVIGSFPALNARQPDTLDDWIKRIKEGINDFENKNPDKITAPFAVNQICHKSNVRLISDRSCRVLDSIDIKLDRPLKVFSAIVVTFFSISELNLLGT